MAMIPIVEEFLTKELSKLPTGTKGEFVRLSADADKALYDAMIEFAKLHVEAFRKEVSENVSLIKECGKENSLNCNAVFCRSCLDIINKDSILNAYPLTLIK